MKKYFVMAAAAVLMLGLASCSDKSKVKSNLEKINDLKMEIREIEKENDLLEAKIIQNSTLEEYVEISKDIVEIEVKNAEAVEKQKEDLKKIDDEIVKIKDDQKFKDNKKAINESEQIKNLQKDLIEKLSKIKKDSKD